MVWKELGTEIKYVQTAAVLEILHALLGFVRSPISRTLPQVASRLAIVWFAMDPLYTLADVKVFSNFCLAIQVVSVIKARHSRPVPRMHRSHSLSIITIGLGS